MNSGYSFVRTNWGKHPPVIGDSSKQPFNDGNFEMFVAQKVSASGNPNLFVDSVLLGIRNLWVIENNNVGNNFKNRLDFLELLLMVKRRKCKSSDV